MDSYHKANGAYASIGVQKFEVKFEEIARWDDLLLSTSMDSMLRQRYCTMTLKYNGKIKKGVALNEVCFGTLG